MTWVRPARPWAPIAISVFVIFVWWVVAHNSGSGWVQFLGDAAFGTIVVGLFGPAAALSRVNIRVIAGPTDGTAGLPIAVQLYASRRIRIVPLDPPGPESMVGPRGRRRERDNDMIVVSPRRGVFPQLLVEIATAAPFGLQWWSRRVILDLHSPLHVAPRRGEPLPIPPLDARDSGDTSKPIPTPVGEVRSVRPYRPGDQRRWVHWPSTAHARRLMVREMEEPSAQPVTLKLSLPHDDEAAERAAEQALGTALALLLRRSALVMVTDEISGEVTAPVRDRLEAGRRLARAVAGGGWTEIGVSG